MANTTPINERRKAILEKTKRSHPSNFWNSLWKFVNSNFGLFILGSIVLAGLTTVVSSKIQKDREALEKRIEANSYCIELEFRLLKLHELADTLMLVDKYNKISKSGLQDAHTDSFKILQIAAPILLKSVKEELNDVINGTGSYRPSEVRFKDQHLISILSWFSFNMEKPRGMYREIEAVYSLQGTPPWGNSIVNDSIIKANLNTLFNFYSIALGYVNNESDLLQKLKLTGPFW